MRFAFRLLNAAKLAALACSLAACGAASAADVSAPSLKPSPPGPEFLSVADHARLQIVIESMKSRQYSVAKSTAATLDDPIAKSLAQWVYHYGEDPKVAIPDADQFLDLHPDWPAVSRVQAHLERQLKRETPSDTVLALFDTREPVTGHGKLMLAHALFAAGRSEAGEIHVRDAWINHVFTLNDERELLASYGRFLKTDDHVARADHLLWAFEVTAARRIFSRLPAAERRMGETRAALLLSARNGAALYEGLPAELRADSGVMLAAVRHFRRAGEEPRAIAIAREAPTDPAILRNPSRWWAERQLLMRWALKERRFEDAYVMAAGHGLESSEAFSEAEFNAGWIALRHLGDPERAETHFRALAASVESPISLARGFYWAGRAAEAADIDARANEYYTLAAEHIYTYYGQLAAERLGGAALERRFEAAPEPTPAESARFAERPLVAALRMLSDVDYPQGFLVFAYHLDDQLETPGEFLAFADIANAENAPHITVRAGKVAVRRNAFTPDVAYPVIAVPAQAERYAPAEVILGLSRQESEFNPRAYSPAGARGLMQLIPSTAQITARKEGLSYSRAALLDDPLYNMVLGSAHLSHLFERFNGSYIMTFAAYNAGPHRVSQWIEAYGDPRAAHIDPIDWVETIPFAETRNYVQRVLENTQIYRSRLTGEPIAGRLSRDLEIGGGNGRAGALPGLRATPAAIGFPLTARIARIAEGLKLPKPPHAEDVIATADGLGLAANAAASTAAEPRSKARPPRYRRFVPQRNNRREPTPSAASPRHIEAVPAAAVVPSPVGASPAQQGSPQEAPPEAPQNATPTALFEAIDPQSGLVDASALRDSLGSTSAAGPTPQGAANGRADAAAPGEADAAGAKSILNDPTAGAAADEGASQDCETYLAYIARIDGEEATAADLNAGMLAEIKAEAETAPCR